MQGTESISSGSPADSTGPEVVQSGLGPASRAYIIPPRPKPGRKPKADSENDERRRKQNRDAQRQFRDRRAQRVYELQEALDDTNQHHIKRQNQHVLECQSLRQQLNQAKSQLAERELLVTQLQDQMEQLRKELDGAKQRDRLIIPKQEYSMVSHHERAILPNDRT